MVVIVVVVGYKGEKEEWGKGGSVVVEREWWDSGEGWGVVV